MKQGKSVKKIRLGHLKPIESIPIDEDANPPLDKLSKIQLINIIEEGRNINHEVNVELDTYKARCTRLECQIKSVSEKSAYAEINHYNEKERLIDLLRGCKNQLEALRGRNDILEAKVSVIDSFNRAMNGQSYSCGADQPDITYYLTDVIEGHEKNIRIQNACSKVECNPCKLSAQEAYQDSGPANCKSPE
jgi:hypothetical protein